MASTASNESPAVVATSSPRRRLRRAAIALAMLASAAIAACNVLVIREGSVHAKAEADVRHADAILVLGAGVHADGSPSDVLVDRLATASRLYFAGAANRVLLTGDSTKAHYDEPAAMKRWLRAAGVPDDAMILDGGGVDTYSSMWRARNVFHLKSAVVVTQGFHLSRALYVGDRIGIQVEGVRADQRRYRSGVFFAAREVISRTKAVFDVARKRTPSIVGR